jgi:hypothetical protein
LPRGLVAETEDEDAGLDLFGREQVEAAGLPAELHLCGGGGGERDIGQSVGEGGVAGLIEGGEPVVEETSGRRVGDEAHLVAEAGQVNENEGVNGADVFSPPGGDGGVGGITEDDGVDLVGIVLVVISRGGTGGCAGGTIGSGFAGGQIWMPVVAEGIEDGGERSDGGNDREQDGSRAERLASSEIEAWSGESGDSGGQRLLHGWSSVFRTGWVGRGPAW